MESAASNIEIAQLCQKWGAIDLTHVMRKAAYVGDIEIMQQCKGWGATNFNEAMRSAASSGDIEIVRRCKKWGVTDCNWIMRTAAYGGHIEIVRLCKEWGATDLNGAMRSAAFNGHIEIVRWCKEWGATQFHEAMQEVKDNRHIKTQILLRNYWLGYDEVHESLFRYHHKRQYHQILYAELLPVAWHPNRCMIWCLDEYERAKWSAAINERAVIYDFDAAVKDAVSGGPIEMAQLYEEWGIADCYEAILQVRHVKTRILLRNWAGYDKIHESLFRHHHKRRSRQIHADLMPVAWHPNRVADWCLTKEERDMWKCPLF